MVFESPGHAGDQVNVVVHTAAHTAVHQRAHGWLLGARIKEVLCFVVAVHRAPGESILREREMPLRRLLKGILKELQGHHLKST